MNGLGRKKQKKEEKQHIFTPETLGVVLCLFATLCAVCLITREKVFSLPGQSVNAFLFGCFGVFAYAVCLFAVIIGVCLITGKKTGINARQKTFITLTFILAALLAHAISMRDYSALSYGEYLVKAYNLAAGGGSTASAGGLFLSLISYPLTTLLTNVGAYVILSILLGVALYFMGVEVVKTYKEKTSGEAAPQTINGVEVMGEREYPVDNVSYNGTVTTDIHATDGAMADNGDSADKPLRTEMTESVYPTASTADVKPVDTGAVPNDVATKPAPQAYSETQGWTMQDKLDYILRPMTYEEMNKYGNPTSGTRVSGYVNPRRAEADGDEAVADVPPMYEHNGAEETKPNDRVINTDDVVIEDNAETDGDTVTDGLDEKPTADVADDAAARAEDFTARYVEYDWSESDGYYTEETVELDGSDDEPREVSFRPVEGGFGGRVGFGANLEDDGNAEGASSVADDAVSYSEDTVDEGGNDNGTDGEDDDFSPRRRNDIFSEENDVDESADDSDEEVKPSALGEGRRRGIFGNDESDELTDGQGTEDIISRGRRADYTSRVEADDNGDARRPAQKPSDDEPLPTRTLPVKPVQEEEEKPTKPERPPKKPYVRPPIDLLENYYSYGGQAEDHEGRMQAIKDKLAEFNINVEPQDYIQGPSITRYEVKMPAGVSVKKILNYDDDLKSCLFSRFGIRIEAPIPGKNLVGIEVENKHKVTVGLRELIMKMSSEPSKPGSLVFAIGKDIVGNCITHNISKAPHYLVAGATGSGKSVALNAMIISLIMRYSPDELRLILIDPKSVGFGMYKRIPHLLIDEIITETPRALAALQWAQVEMERRYKLFAEGDIMSSDIDAYNSKLPKDAEKLPRIVFVVDELADLMESNKKEMEQRIQVLVQKSRAAGIHLVLATQRPSVNVIPGTIKANLNVRMALKVLTATDSQTILGNAGAEKLLGNGDMLFRDSAMPEAERYQGAWISDAEIANVVSFIKENNTAYFEEEVTQYLDRSVRAPQDDNAPASSGGGKGDENDVDELFLKALWLGVNSGTMSISQLIRRFQIGYGKAGGIVDKMERMGFITGNEGSKARKVLLTREQYEERFGPASDA